MKKLLNSLLVAIVVVGVVLLVEPVSVEAASVVEVDTVAEWAEISNAQSGTTYKITKDIADCATITIPSGKDIIIDLNGCVVTGPGAMIVNNGVLTIKDSIGDGEIQLENTYRNADLLTNNGTFHLESGYLCTYMEYSNAATLTAKVNVLKNNGTFRMNGGCVTGYFEASSNHIDQVLNTVYNAGDMKVTGGEITMFAAADAYTYAGGAQLSEVNALYNESTSSLQISSASIGGIFDYMDGSDMHIASFAGISHNSTGEVRVANSTILLMVEGLEDMVDGIACGIYNASGGNIYVDSSQIVTEESDDATITIVGILNEQGNIYVGTNSQSNDERVDIASTEVSAISTGVFSMSETGEVIVNNATISADMGLLNIGAASVILGKNDGVIDNTNVEIIGDYYAVVCEEYPVIIYDGTFIGDMSEAITLIPEGLILKDISSTTCVIAKSPAVLREEFVVRLYNVCLGRQPDAGGKANWINRLEKGLSTGIQAANGFIFSQEFKNKNYCNVDFVKQLYRSFMGREADAAGLEGWVKNLNSGMTREAVFNGFALSKEFRNLCSEYGIKLGSAIKVPKYGTIPTGSCSACGVEDGVTAFVKRLYRVCLDREADAGGLASWSKQLWNHTSSGRKVAQGFIFSQEFTNKNYSNKEFVEHLYLAFMGREADAGGLAGWVKNLERGMTRKQVFNGFAGSKEFTNICNQYGILRD